MEQPDDIKAVKNPRMQENLEGEGGKGKTCGAEMGTMHQTFTSDSERTEWES